MPTLGLGVYMNEECAEACKVAIQNGYRWVLHIRHSLKTQLNHYSMIDGARYYENEVQVGVGVGNSGVKREDIFISEDISSGSSCILISHTSGSLRSFQGLSR